MGFQAASQANVDDDAGPMIVAVAMAVATLSGLALVARLTSRQIQKKRFGPSDLLVVLGLLCAWVVSVLAVLSWSRLASRTSRVKDTDASNCRCEDRSWSAFDRNYHKRRCGMEARSKSLGTSDVLPLPRPGTHYYIARLSRADILHSLPRMHQDIDPLVLP